MKRIYTNSEYGLSETSEADGKEFCGLPAPHQTPGMGLGRECAGFFNSIDFLGDDGKVATMKMKEGQAPMRVSLWKPQAKSVNVWLVSTSASRSEIDRLRELMWPDTRL